jgi:hypothetical protein
MLWDQLLQLKGHIRIEVEKLKKLLSDQYIDYEITDKQVDMLAQLYVRILNDGNAEVLSRLASIQQALGVRFVERTEKARFYKTAGGYERARFVVLKIPERVHISRLVQLANLTDLYDRLMIAPQDGYVLRDVVQLSKIVMGAVVHGSNMEREVNLIHSNLSGYANLISRRQFISRSTVQAVNGQQVILGVEGSRYRYAFLSDMFTERNEVTLFGKSYNFTKSDLKDSPSSVPVLAVASSKYQVQFLDWFMGKHSKKKTVLGGGGAFCIVEKTVTLDWSGEQPRIASLTEPRVFVSQPFSINPTSGEGTKAADNRFVGVDIGEYGLAWSLIEVTDLAVRQVDSGFIADPQQQILKSAVQSLRDKQVRATFVSPDTRVARIRESLIGAYRNQLEDLAMRKNARLSFEYEVSGFETGGNRVAKIYDSIKRGSIRKKENNAQNKMAWGDRGIDNWGFETTAAGTSQFCSSCKRWASLAIDDGGDYELQSYDDGLFSTEIADGRIRLLGKQDMPLTIKGKDLKGLAYKSMRPNIDGLGMNIVEKKLGVKKFSDLKKEFGQNKSRGNIAIFICPYCDCHHVSDADKQAAFNIAVRGYIKSVNPERAKKSGDKGLSAEFLTMKESKMKFEPVQLVFDQKNNC